jgi:uncharacterized membrane protein YkoI
MGRVGINKLKQSKETSMKIKSILCSALVIGLFAGCASEKHKHHESLVQLQAQAKVSQADAEKTALAQAPNGTIKEAELEREKGKLIWSFDIATPGTQDITEVGVDALTGKVVGVEKETAARQAKEKKEDQKEEK